MAPAPQDSSQGESNATQGNLAETLHAPEDDSAHIDSAPLGARSKGKKRRRSSSGGVKGNLPNNRGPKVAGVLGRAKGTRAQKAGSWGANSSPLEEKHEKYSKEGRDWEAEPCMFTGVPAQRFTDYICCSLKAKIMI